MLLVDPQQTVLYRNTAMLQQLIPLLDPMRAGSQNPTTLGELMGLFTSLNLVERTYELNTENSDPQRFRITREVLADYPGFDVVSFQNVTAELQARSAQKVLRQQHDFNNIASVLVANYGIINEAVAPMIDPLRNLGEVRRGDSVESLEKLAGAYDDMQIGMRRLVDFCRESTQLRLSSPNVAPSIVYQVYEVGKILQEALRWQEPIRKRYGHEVEISIEPDLRIAGQDFPILNAAINLIKNAYEAMSPGGRLSVKAWRESTNAVLEVTDTGPGIPPEVQPRIFEPFFTTKGKTGGSGFGLANALEGVRAQGGMIEFETRLGVGTTFRVTLPILQKD
jgi:signal transduction histidine kinase